MSLYKRGKTWHTHFYVDGVRYRESLKTSDWREAQGAERKLIASAEAGKIANGKQAIARMSFSEAAEQFLTDRLSRLAPLSVRTEKERAKVVNRTFGAVIVSRIAVADVLEYIRKRKTENIANATVNRELDIIRGVLKKAKRWHLFADEIKPLPLRHGIGRALSYDEKLRLLKVAVSRPEWQTACWAAILALNTTMRGCEIKGLRWRDVDFLGKAVTVRRSKTEAGERLIPLNADALKTVLSLYQRAKQLGEVQLDHYVFPACEAGHIDPSRSQSSWRTAWRNMRAAAGLPKLRFHDLRHHAITELAESQASDSTVMSIAGHVSQKMLAHYSHVRVDAKRKALDSLASRQNTSRAQGYDTNNDTNPTFAAESDSTTSTQVSDLTGFNLVELVGIEPTASSLRTMRSPS